MRQEAGEVASASSARSAPLRPPFTRVYVMPSRRRNERGVLHAVVGYYKFGGLESHDEPFEARAEHVCALTWHMRAWRPSEVLRRSVREARARAAPRLLAGRRRGSAEPASLSGGKARRSGAGGTFNGRGFHR